MSVKCCLCVDISVRELSFVLDTLLPIVPFLQTKYRQKADSIRFTQVADDLYTKHAKKSQELQSDVSSLP